MRELFTLLVLYQFDYQIFKEGEECKLFKQRAFTEIEELRRMMLEPSNTQKPHSFEVRKKALVPPELEVYVQPSVFIAFDKEFKMYRS